MKLVIQRVSRALVRVNNEITGQINKGLVVLVGFTNDDSMNDIDMLVNKLINLRIFEDDCGKMNLSLIDIGGSILSVSQFTLYADTKNGRRPSFLNSLVYHEAEMLYNKFNDKLRENKIEVGTGVFGADMKLELINDGPVTILLDSKEN